MSLDAASTLSAVIRLALPISSASPHLDGSQSLSAAVADSPQTANANTENLAVFMPSPPYDPRFIVSARAANVAVPG